MIPDYQTLMLPLLENIADGGEHQLRTVINSLSDEFNLTESERNELLPSGNQAIIDNRVGWARTYLKKAGLLDYPRRGILKINNKGIEILSRKLSKIDVRFLKSLPEFKEWHDESYNKNQGTINSGLNAEIETEKTPQELLDYSYLKLKEELANEVLEKVKNCSPAFFEKLVVELLLKMGYGGSKKEAGEVLGKSNDGGIDGVIKEDKLGLDTIYIQAKRYENTVPIGQVRDFAGALLGNKAKKGIFITTSDCPTSAKDYVKSIDPKIVLIEGKQLSSLMIEYNVGVSTIDKYEIKRIDTDYFDDI